jgi:hypothetical protein
MQSRLTRVPTAGTLLIFIGISTAFAGYAPRRESAVFSVTPLIETGVQNTSYNASVFNPALLGQLAWDLDTGFGFGYALLIPMSISRSPLVRPHSISGGQVPIIAGIAQREARVVTLRRLDCRRSAGRGFAC